MYHVNTDGACTKNPGGALGIGVFIYDDRTGEKHYISERCGIGTSNEAEYIAVIKALEKLVKIGPRQSVLIQSDSTLIVNTITNRWKTHKPHLKPYRDDAQKLQKYLQDKYKIVISYKYIPRENNMTADILSKRCLS